MIEPATPLDTQPAVSGCPQHKVEDDAMNWQASPVISANVAAVAALVISIATGRSVLQAIIIAVLVAIVAYAVTVFQSRRSGRP